MAAAPDGRIITGSDDKTVKVWRDGACERTIQAHTRWSMRWRCCRAARASSAARSTTTAKLFTFGGELERTFEVGSACSASRRCPTACTLWSAGRILQGDVRLYHVDGTLVHTFEGHTGTGARGGGDARRPAHHQRLARQTVKVWSVASKSLVSTCAGHTDSVYAVAAMPDGQRILSGSTDNTVRVWLLDGTLENTFQLHTDT